MRRGRRHPQEIIVGNVIEWGCVEAFEPGHLLRLSPEMRLPGRAWLEFRVEKQGNSTLIKQTAVLDPVGLLGLACWYAVYPLHAIVFKGMLAGIVRESEVHDGSLGS